MNEANEHFEVLLSVCRSVDIPLSIRYKQVRDLLERICREQTEDKSLQMTDLAARINYVAAKAGLTTMEQNRLHTFRLTSNKILNREEKPGQEKLLRDVKTVSFFIKKLYGAEIPTGLYRLLPKADATYIVAPPARRKIKRMRACFRYADEKYLYVSPIDSVSDDLSRVHYNIDNINHEFNDTVALLWEYAQINLLDVSEDEEGILTPSFIVLEPDYLIDISSLAECFKDYGHHPLNYQLNKLQPIENARPLLLGNIVNLFLDEWIYAKEEPDYNACMKKAFRKYPIELVACGDLQDKGVEKQFFADCRKHFDHIHRVVRDIFPLEGYGLSKEEAVLEPAYICESLGLQGRLDYMRQDMSAFIEMKSGKADEYSLRGKIEPKENNLVQMRLYQAVLRFSMGIDYHDVRSYLLYTRYPLLYPASSSRAMVRRAINLRNQIVSDEYGVQLRNNIEYTFGKLLQIKAGNLNQKNLSGRFWEAYLCPSIGGFAEKLRALTPLERAYFSALYNFITKEQYTSKSGDMEYDGRAGSAALWLAPLDEKSEAGGILYDLLIKENRAADEHQAFVTLSRQEEEQGEGGIVCLPNFRQGDTIVLYERNRPEDNVTNKMVFKGNIEYITDAEVRVRLRAAQQNPRVLPADSRYAIEHDSMDTTFRSMFLGLSAFMSANKDRRELLLGVREPEVAEAPVTGSIDPSDNFTRIALKAAAANDYFLLMGPPGTGKTSRALKRMVELFHERGEQVLLLSYTNRAVDEICKALTSISPAVDFIRVGSELSCDAAYRGYLIENVLSGCNRRQEVRERIDRCRIFVGTVATLSNKPELFRLKRFDVAVIDEASQILEPQLLGILCARTPDGANAVGKFVLIGDHKQLPAVVLQSAAQTEVYDDSLRAAGVVNLRDSLFERLYRRHYRSGEKGGSSPFCDMLSRQGRMHPEVADFPNRMFYGGRLVALGLEHQVEQWPDIRRVSFYPSEAEPSGGSAKINHSEARIVARLAVDIYDRFSESFDENRTLGVIAPYRSQIALIKKELAKTGREKLSRILVDTVERFQGSERDVIIYSFCVNQPYQLKYLCNTIEEDGNTIDRKLNVALTRARKQLLITGVSQLLKQNLLYSSLLKLANKEV